MVERMHLPEPMDNACQGSSFVNNPPVLKQIAEKRACLLKAGELDLGKAVQILLEEFRNGKLGRITLELPENKCQM